ncbi:MAG: beta-ketoacyl-ACP synthase III, partial [Gammaproteobacteria bacterium]
GSIIAFHQYRADFGPGERGVICSFGAGYSVGRVVVERLG